MEKGNLNNTYQFDFGTSYAYQIQLPKKLIQLERCFLDHEDQFGFVEAQLSANPTDIKLLDPTDTAIQTPKFASTTKVDIPDDLVALRQELFVLIKSQQLTVMRMLALPAPSILLRILQLSRTICYLTQIG